MFSLNPFLRNSEKKSQKRKLFILIPDRTLQSIKNKHSLIRLCIVIELIPIYKCEQCSYQTKYNYYLKNKYTRLVKTNDVKTGTRQPHL